MLSSWVALVKLIKFYKFLFFTFKMKIKAVPT